MNIKRVSGLMLMLMLLTGMLTLMSSIQSTNAAYTEWIRTYGDTSSWEEAYSMVQTSDGGYALAGRKSSSSWLVKTDSEGNIHWDRTYGELGQFNWAWSMVQTSDGGYAEAGFTDIGGYDIFLLKTDAEGNMLWRKTFGGANMEGFWGCSVTQTFDEGYAIGSYTYSFGAGGSDFWLIKTDEEGNMQWSLTYGGPGNEISYSVIQTRDGGYAMAGSEYTALLVKIDAEGTMQWSQIYGGFDSIRSVVQTNDEGYAMVGTTDGFSHEFLIKTDSKGNLQWSKKYVEQYGQAYSVVQTNDEGYAIAGIAGPPTNQPHDCWLIETDSLGNIQWEKTYSITRDNYAQSVVQTSDGGYAIAGFTGEYYLEDAPPGAQFDALLIKINTYAPSSPDFEISVSPRPPILVYVGGSTSASLTLKSVNGFSGSIQLSYSSPPDAKTTVSFSQNPVYLNAGSEVTVPMVMDSYFDTSTSRFGVLGEYTFVVTATDGSTTHDFEVTIKLVPNTVAINNIVRLQQIPKSDPTFSVQQNFLIATADGRVLYWAQNIVCVRPNPSFGSGSRIWSTFQAFTENTNFVVPPPQAVSWPYMGVLAMYIDSNIVSFPTTLNLTSYIDGSDLVLTNNASSRLNTVRLTLPAGSYLVGYSGKYEHQFMGDTYGFDHASPEIAIVGAPPLVGSSTADFKTGTKGSVECSVKLFGESDWGSRSTLFMYANVNRPQTAERSLHLAWNRGNTFNYDKTINDPSTAPQGVSFSPTYP